MCKFITKAIKKVAKETERVQNKLLKPVGINTNIFGGGIKSGSPAEDEGPSDIEALATQANEELAEEKSKATEDTIQQTSAKRFRSGSRGRRSLLRSKSGGGAGFYNRFQL
tara:strand:- start:102 stop:434 length:333 start_codon:yes stop_codon:yes gene_type:complete